MKTRQSLRKILNLDFEKNQETYLVGRLAEVRSMMSSLLHWQPEMNLQPVGRKIQFNVEYKSKFI